MDTKTWLTRENDETLTLALKTFGKSEKQLENDIETIKEWMKTQHHLPEISSDRHIMNFLLANKWSLENTKQKLDMYYTIRHLIPELYEGYNMNQQDLEEMSKELYIFPLPRRTEDGCRVLVSKIQDGTVDNFSLNKYSHFGMHTVEVVLQEDVMFEDIIIVDLEHTKMGHFFKITPFDLKKLITVMEKVFSNKVRQMHVVNCPKYAASTINLAKQFIKPKIAERIFVHDGTDTLSNIMSPKILPRDYGGLELSLSELNDLWKQKLFEYQDRFRILNGLRTNENLRPEVLQNDEILGYHGNFRKLEMD